MEVFIGINYTMREAVVQQILPTNPTRAIVLYTKDRRKFGTSTTGRAALVDTL